MGKFVEETYEAYHKSDGIRWSSLAAYAKSPEAYHYGIRFPEQEKSPSLAFGSILDLALLEPNKVSEFIAIIPNDVLAKDGSKRGSNWEEWKDTQKGKHLLKAPEWAELQLAIDNVWSNPACRDILVGMHVSQVSMYWEDRKCRYDGLLPNGFFDLKTTRHHPSDFYKAVREYRYDQQMAWYTDGWNSYGDWPDDLFWLVVHNEPPFESAVYYPDVQDIVDAMQENEKIYKLFKHSLKENTWQNQEFHKPLLLDMGAGRRTLRS